jgi:hypothetical protein
MGIEMESTDRPQSPFARLPADTPGNVPRLKMSREWNQPPEAGKPELVYLPPPDTRTVATSHNTPELMARLGIPITRSDAERQAHLKQLSPEELLGGIALISSAARSVTPEQNTPGDHEQTAVYQNGSSLEQASGILYIAPARKYGEQAIADALEVAKRLPSTEPAGALLRLIIPLAHVQKNGNGAAARFYHKLIKEGYDGTAAVDARYQQLLTPSGRPVSEHPEARWNAAFAQYYAHHISVDKDFAFTPVGYTDAKWQGRKLRAFPFLRQGGGTYMVEHNFATAFDLDFMAETGRDLQDYTVTLRQGSSKDPYINTKKLLRDASVEESSLARRIGDSHKTAYLNAINSHFSHGGHPAFRPSRGRRS